MPRFSSASCWSLPCEALPLLLVFSARSRSRAAPTPTYRTDAFRAQLTAPYTLASGDRIRVIVFGQDAISNSYAVNGSGMISMPLIGDVAVVGLTTTETERLIENRLRAGFLRDPHVSVEVEAFRPFFVLGEVTTAGQYPFINGMTVQKAIAVAGGFSARADRGTGRHHAHGQRNADHRQGSAVLSAASRRYHHGRRTLLLVFARHGAASLLRGPSMADVQDRIRPVTQGAACAARAAWGACFAMSWILHASRFDAAMRSA